ncbi:hypothetical protein Acsp07_46100 [Actinomycetospora sp. NBRC 106378]|nr:hypothetical protein Acsp07_46100 [Actinomycetospora sp. NBRC 106378]
MSRRWRSAAVGREQSAIVGSLSLRPSSVTAREPDTARSVVDRGVYARLAWERESRIRHDPPHDAREVHTGQVRGLPRLPDVHLVVRARRTSATGQPPEDPRDGIP